MEGMLPPVKGEALCGDNANWSLSPGVRKGL